MTLVLGDELMFPSEFLTHVDLKGRPVAVTIEELNIDDLRTQRGKTRKVVARLVGKEKKFVMNKTNCRRIAEVYGNQAKAWVGKVIVIKPDKDRFGSDVVDCIRVDVAATKAKAKGAKPGPKQEEPAHNPETGEVEEDYSKIGPPAMSDEQVAHAESVTTEEDDENPAPAEYRRPANTAAYRAGSRR